MIRSSRLLPALLVATAIAAGPIFAPPPAMAADEVDTETIAEKYAALLERDYLYSETGKRYADAIRAAIAAGRYKGLSGEALGAAVDSDVNAVAPDGHLRLRVPEAAADAAAPAPGGAAPVRRSPKVPVEQAGWIAPGIAFVRFNVFPMDDAVTAEAAKFMADHADAKAIIFDIRTHNGGGLDQMDAIFPWLFDKETRLVTMATRASVDAEGGSPIAGIASMRMVKGDAGMVAREHWATPNEDRRLRDAKVYVLTSGASASAAEHFALAMKHTGRGVLVGAPTAGANHFGRGEQLGGGYGAFIPVGRTYDPVTGKDWEGEGVLPDIAAPPAEALARALTELGVAPAEAKRLSDAHMPSWPMERRRPRGAR
ncbi:S41 family peptidase [Sphingopyxis sp.]|uniref:S41 family peptidase n=1 Tax=Sphingopyxis sp. TaxID=1908224 RepID=UPI002D7694C0|nr:S41 family peptidase [Sphingopyxis sp.]HET6524776.1 S41 family peptidase [Sphingopyxis sp.]